MKERERENVFTDTDSRVNVLGVSVVEDSGVAEGQESSVALVGYCTKYRW